jgi:hypothetical protein
MVELATADVDTLKGSTKDCCIRTDSSRENATKFCLLLGGGGGGGVRINCFIFKSYDFVSICYRSFPAYFRLFRLFQLFRILPKVVSFQVLIVLYRN